MALRAKGKAPLPLMGRAATTGPARTGPSDCMGSIHESACRWPGRSARRLLGRGVAHSRARRRARVTAPGHQDGKNTTADAWPQLQ